MVSRVVKRAVVPKPQWDPADTVPELSPLLVQCRSVCLVLLTLADVKNIHILFVPALNDSCV